MSAWNYRTDNCCELEYVFPVNAEIHEQLSVRIYSHDLPSIEGPIPCWTYVTNGLRSVEQSELVLTIKREARETPHQFPEDPLRWFTQIFQWALQGMLVTVGGRSTLQSGHFVTPGIVGVLYQNALPLEGIELPAEALCMVPVTSAEMDAAEEFGPLRTLCLLGNRFRYYPFPPWFDRTRESVIDTVMLDAMRKSLSAAASRAIVRGMRVSKHGSTLHAVVSPANIEGFRQLFKQMPPAIVHLRLAIDLDEDAYACLVWQVQGTQTPLAITKPLPGVSGVRSTTDIRVAGTFLSLLINPIGLAYRVLEDGYALMLGDNEWTQLKAALQEGRELTIDLQDEQKFKLSWDTPSIALPDVHEAKSSVTESARAALFSRGRLGASRTSKNKQPDS
jgi:hypothetical protein